MTGRFDALNEFLFWGPIVLFIGLVVTAIACWLTGRIRPR